MASAERAQSMVYTLYVYALGTIGPRRSGNRAITAAIFTLHAAVVVTGRCRSLRVAAGLLESRSFSHFSGSACRALSFLRRSSRATFREARERVPGSPSSEKMKPAYMICALLSLTIGTLAMAGMTPHTQQEARENTPHAALAKNAKLPEPVTLAPTPNVTSETTTSHSTITPTANPTVAPEPIKPNVTTTPNVTTPIPSPTTVTTPTVAPTTKSTAKPVPTTAEPNPTSPSTHSSTPEMKTTARPTTLPSSKDRQFDGLSFFGGIILTTCLMAIAVFSWKFWRQCKEGNYRTL
ncbi:PREDICTED: sialomucin core protein 24-like [Vollenhovia emeryi]|uniref:sialomucin core protein 24-like n=1 Tax=Vollenhovia emeryi TaxID=411798 RepID=UPI0005F47725|nr:PREDICTED: sialomucin core protein 24-like [Vollenhovia emeryi]